MRSCSAALMVALSLSGCARQEVVDSGKFRSIPPGATYQWVVQVIGSAGRVYQASEDIQNGLVPRPGETAYIWTNKDGSGVTIAFRNGHVSAMAAWGLH
jgi:hypothetical protein